MINEQDAVRRCQSGDREAFRPIVEYYGDVLMGTLYLMTHDRPVSEELVQETFVRAWKGIATFRLGEPVKPWLVRIAVNQALNAKARHQLSVEPLSEADQGSTDPAFGYVNDKDEVRRALSQLSNDHQRVVALRYFTDLSTREVASERKIVGFDVTELSPGEGPEAGAFTAAKLVQRVIGYSVPAA